MGNRLVARIGGKLLRAVRRARRVPNRFMSYPFYLASRYSDLKPTRKCFSHSGAHVFFGYYDLDPFSINDELLLAGRTRIPLRSPGQGDTLDVGYFRLDAEYRQFIPVDTTESWCWQQGCRLRWYPAAANRKILYNNIVGGRLGSVIQDVFTKKIESFIPAPLYDVTPDGTKGLTLDFVRLQRLRPGYGYGGLPDPTRGVSVPAGDGVWVVELLTGTRALLVDMADLVKVDPTSSMAGAEHYINHISINPSGTAFLFLHLWVANGSGRRFSRIITCDMEGNGLRVWPMGETASHYSWVSDSEFSVVWNAPDVGGPRYFRVNRFTGEKGVVGGDWLREDGHQSFLREGRWMLTDTYPNTYRDQLLLMLELKSNRLYCLDRFHVPSEFSGEVRCDLHPRVSKSEGKICVDVIVNGYRGMAVLDLGMVADMIE